jgi:hypothetical protein
MLLDGIGSLREKNEEASISYANSGQMMVDVEWYENVQRGHTLPAQHTIYCLHDFPPIPW